MRWRVKWHLLEEKNIKGKILEITIILNDYLTQKSSSITKQVVRGDGLSGNRTFVITGNGQEKQWKDESLVGHKFLLFSRLKSSFLGDAFSRARKTRYKNVALLREAKTDWRWELGNSSCLVHLYSGTFFFVDDNLNTLRFHTVLFREGTLKYAARSRGWGLCGDSTLSYLQRKRSFLFSEEHFRTGMNPQPFPGTASTQLRLGRNISPEWRWAAWLTRSHAGFRRPGLLSPGPSALGSGADSSVSTTELGPWLRPAFPGNPRGRGGSVVSFPLHLGFFFHFTED